MLELLARAVFQYICVFWWFFEVLAGGSCGVAKRVCGFGWVVYLY